MWRDGVGVAIRRVEVYTPARVARTHFLESLVTPQGRAASLMVDRPTGQVPLATTVEAAFDSESRRRGLLGRPSLPRGTALVIAPSNGVHTFFMKFAIDIAFADRDGRVVKITRGVKPWRVALARSGFAVIEMAAGTFDRVGLARGDRLRVTPVR